MKVYLVRHGKTEWNAERRLQGTGDSPLLPNNDIVFKNTASKLQGIKFDVIGSSVLKRAKDSLELLLKYMNIGEVERFELPEFNEIHFGKWEGMKIDDIEIQYPRIAQAYWNNVGEYNAKDIDAESIDELYQRYMRGIEKLKEKYGDDATILIMTHGTTMSVAKDYKKDENYEKNIIENGGYFILNY